MSTHTRSRIILCILYVYNFFFALTTTTTFFEFDIIFCVCVCVLEHATHLFVLLHVCVCVRRNSFHTNFVYRIYNLLCVYYKRLLAEYEDRCSQIIYVATYTTYMICLATLTYVYLPHNICCFGAMQDRTQAYAILVEYFFSLVESTYICLYSQDRITSFCVSVYMYENISRTKQTAKIIKNAWTKRTHSQSRVCFVALWRLVRILLHVW